MSKASLTSVEVSGVKADAHATVPRRRIGFENNLTAEVVTKSAKTIYEAFKVGKAKKDNGNGNFLGWRTRNEDGTPGPFTWYTYNQGEKLINNIGSAIVHLNLAPKDTREGSEILQGGAVGIYSKNRPEWVLTEHGCFSQNLVTVPLYDTLGEDAVSFVVEQTALKVVFCSDLEVNKLIEFKTSKADAMKSLTDVVVFEQVEGEVVEKAKNVGLTIHQFSKLIEIGEANNKPHVPPSPDDICTICYTSGTTGNPKGALLRHSNLIAVSSAAVFVGLDLRASDEYLSYLPLAHVFERLVQVALIWSGAAIGFYQGDTLKLVEDLATLRPTVFCSVPRLYNKFYDKIMNGAKSAGGIKTALFERAYNAKKHYLAQDNVVHHWLWDKLVFHKLAARLGLERCRIMVTGSAPIAPHVLEFLRIVFSANVIEGYGQSEGSGVTSATNIEWQNRFGNVGSPIPYNEIRLVDVPDMGYLHTDTIHGKDEKTGAPGIKCFGRGEICYRGLNVFPGYFRDQAKTDETIIDGWLHSGDIGLFDENGNLRIIDRKKNIFKLSQGEYVAAERLEQIAIQSNYISQIFLYGDSLHSCLVALISPDEDSIRNWVKANHPEKAALPFADLCKLPEVKAEIQRDMKQLAKAAHLNGFEQARDIFIDPRPWTPDNILTPSFKIKRADAKKYYEAEIDAMYKAIGDSVAGVDNIKQQ